MAQVEPRAGRRCMVRGRLIHGVGRSSGRTDPMVHGWQPGMVGRYGVELGGGSRTRPACSSPVAPSQPGCLLTVLQDPLTPPRHLDSSTTYPCTWSSNAGCCTLPCLVKLFFVERKAEYYCRFVTVIGRLTLLFRKDLALSFLPSTHVLGRLVGQVFARGGCPWGAGAIRP
jgi:hypothetical protein